MANLTVKGKVLKHLAQTVQGEFITDTVVIETKADSKYPEILAIEYNGKDDEKKAKIRAAFKALPVGQEVEFEANVTSREWQGRYFHSVRAWKFSSLAPVQTSGMSPNTSFDKGDTKPIPTVSDDELPF